MALANLFSIVKLANMLASLLTLPASGLALVIGLRDVMNFAHGALFMLGAHLAHSVSGFVGFRASSASLLKCDGPPTLRSLPLQEEIGSAVSPECKM